MGFTSNGLFCFLQFAMMIPPNTIMQNSRAANGMQALRSHRRTADKRKPPGNARRLSFIRVSVCLSCGVRGLSLDGKPHGRGIQAQTEIKNRAGQRKAKGEGAPGQ